MAAPSLILLHAPSVYDFRQHTILRGPVSDLIPSSSVFEMYPMGFATIAAHLEDSGFRVRIVNLAARMLQNSNFDVEAFIGGLPRPLAFGIDLHWLPHAQGSLAIAEVLRRFHPDVPILFGGFSASYFHEELIRYPQVDLIMRGDSTEGAVRLLMEALKSGGDMQQIPNLTWRDGEGQIHVNPLRYSPHDLGMVDLDFRRMMVAAARDRDLLSYLPFLGWLNYPIMPVVVCRGCKMNCLGCGGSAFAFKHLHGRSTPAFRPPEKLADDLHRLESVSKGPIFILGDIRQAGADYARRFLDAAQGVKTPVIVEFFTPASADFLRQLARSLPNFAVEVSIESHDPAVRRAYGKPYPNDAMESMLRNILDVGARRLDVFFMTGLPHQTYQSVLDSADYAEGLLKTFGGDGRLRPFIGPMAPFVDPGSRAFEEPHRHGYHIFHRTLEDHRRALLEPSWEYTLNYETRWMSRHEIVHSTYDACMRFNMMKVQHNLVDAAQGAAAYQALAEGKLLAEEIAKLRDNHQTTRIAALRHRIEWVNALQGVAEDQELQFMRSVYAFKPLRLLWMLARAWLRDRLRHLRILHDAPHQENVR